ncbi:MAG: hypothetical protein GY790_14655 [Bacteroidetes bacterium]|nr:hypothetical protein [Bacteroidota bacterium]
MTKKGILILSLFIGLIAMPAAMNGQCKQFAKNTCKPGLDPYQHDGNYDAAALLIEGEEADMYRVLHSDINYRIGVCGSGNLSSIHFVVQDVRDDYKVIYDNSEHDFEWKWDVKLESSRQLRIVVSVPVSDENTTSPEEGCVSVMIGSTDF